MKTEYQVIDQNEKLLANFETEIQALDETLIELSRLPQFCNADPSDLYDMISAVEYSFSNDK